MAIRSLEEVARIAYEMRDPRTGKRLIPSPLKQSVDAILQNAFRKMRRAAPELEDFLPDDSDERDTIAEQRGRFMAARGA